MKRLLSIVAATALSLGLATSAMAYGGHHYGHGSGYGGYGYGYGGFGYGLAALYGMGLIPTATPGVCLVAGTNQAVACPAYLGYPYGYRGRH